MDTVKQDNELTYIDTAFFEEEIHVITEHLKKGEGHGCIIAKGPMIWIGFNCQGWMIDMTNGGSTRFYHHKPLPYSIKDLGHQIEIEYTHVLESFGPSESAFVCHFADINDQDKKTVAIFPIDAIEVFIQMTQDGIGDWGSGKPDDTSSDTPEV